MWKKQRGAQWNHRGVCVCVHSHGLLVELVPDASRHVFEDSDAARHQLQLLVLLLHDQLHTQTHAYFKKLSSLSISRLNMLLLPSIFPLIAFGFPQSCFSRWAETCSLIKSKIFHSLPAKTATWHGVFIIQHHRKQKPAAHTQALKITFTRRLNPLSLHSQRDTYKHLVYISFITDRSRNPELSQVIIVTWAFNWISGEEILDFTWSLI